LARGIDFPGISLVINFDLADKIFRYFHRIGRTGRFGAEGLAITFIQKDEENYLLNIPGINIKKLEDITELVNLNEKIIEQRENLAKKQDKLTEYGISIGKRKSKIKWKESERHIGESLAGEWQDIEKKSNSSENNFQYFEAEISHECECESCKKLDAKKCLEITEFRKKINVLYECENCCEIIENLLNKFENKK